jgi:hypothetical protein
MVQILQMEQLTRHQVRQAEEEPPVESVALMASVQVVPRLVGLMASVLAWVLVSQVVDQTAAVLVQPA